MNFIIENEYIPKELETFIRENEKLYKSFNVDFKGIKPKNVCGFILLNDENYFIVPKICDKNESNLNIFLNFRT